MNYLLQALKDFQSTVSYVLSYGMCQFYPGDLMDQQKFVFEEITRVGDYCVGVARWSPRGEHDPRTSVVYIASPEAVKTRTGEVVSPIIIQEFFEVATKD